MKLIIGRTQYGVGQGGFHACHIDMISPMPLLYRRLIGQKSTRFDFVYDCGTLSPGPGGVKKDVFLKNQIVKYVRNVERLDALFLSHLDEDHYNGAKELCSQTKVGRIFMPYFSLGEFWLLILRQLAITDTAISNGYVNDLLSIVRGTSTRLFGIPVTVVGGPPPDSRVPSTDANNSPEVTLVEIRDDGTVGGLGSWVRNGANIGLILESELLNWMFRPWSYKQSQPAIDAMAKFLRSNKTLATLLAQKNISDDVLKTIKSKKKSIRAAIEKIIRDGGGTYATNNNSPSLCLYSGPRPDYEKRFIATYIERGSPESCLQHDPVGWLGTGDALVKQHWHEFKSCYLDLFKAIGTFMLPHHGSKENHIEDFIDAVSGRLAVIAAGNYTSHPDREVLDYLGETQCVVKQVTEYVQYGLHEIALIEDAADRII